MIIALTGTPGVGKHTVSAYVAKKTGYKIVDINLLLRKKHISEISVERLNKLVSPLISSNELIVSHMAHLLKSKKIDFFVVLRCDPRILIKRLKRRGYSDKKIKENAMFEAIDGEYVESIDLHKNVIQIDNSSNYVRTSEFVIKLLSGEKIRGDNVDYSKYIPLIQTMFG